MPTVIMKSAMTLDGQLAAADGTSQWITGAAARDDVHVCRSGVDAVMVGAGTVLADDPRLDVRLDGYTGPQPTPVIIGGGRDLSADAQVFGRNPITFVPRRRHLPGTVVEMPDASGSRVDLRAALAHLDELGVASVLVEGGAGLLAGLWADDLIDRGIVYFGQKLAGGVGRPLFAAEWSTLDAARPVRMEDARLVGGDVRVEFSFR